MMFKGNLSYLGTLSQPPPLPSGAGAPPQKVGGMCVYIYIYTHV